MAATQLTRSQLTNEFKDGERPSGEDFESAWLSFLNKLDDGLSMDTNLNLVLSHGITLKDTTGAGVAGTLRFSGGQVQIHDGTGFVSLSTGGGGAFVSVGTAGEVAYGGGNVGIGTFTIASPPTHKLEISLGNNTDSNQRVKFGNLVAHNGPSGIKSGIYIVHSNHVSDTTPGYALFQDQFGNTTINSAAVSATTFRTLLLSQGETARITLQTDGAIELKPATSKKVTVTGDLTVTGTFSNPPSDARLKRDIRPFREGLPKLLKLNPIVFKFNGKASTTDDNCEHVGLIAQDLQRVYPELVISQLRKLNQDDLEESEILTYNPATLTFVLINAIKEIAERLDKLEKSKTNEKRKSKITT